MAASSGQKTETASATSIRNARALGRAAAAFLLDVIAITRGEGSVLDAVLMATITQANVAPVSQSADLQVAFAGVDEPPPDALRRPLSVSALANSLRLPFETVRRRVRALADGGHCVMVEGGVVVPASVLSSPENLQRGLLAYERLRGLYCQLRDHGLLTRLPSPTVEMSSGVVPVRAVARLANDYVLRVIDAAVDNIGDLVDTLIVFEVLRSNTEHLSPQVRGAEGAEAEDFVPDELRLPVRVGLVARRLGLPEETVRRHVVLLVGRGDCQRTERGLVIPAAVLARPKVVGALTANAGNLQRMFSGLSQLGVLAIWDALSPAGEPRAMASAAQSS